MDQQHQWHMQQRQLPQATRPMDPQQVAARHAQVQAQHAQRIQAQYAQVQAQHAQHAQRVQHAQARPAVVTATAALLSQNMVAAAGRVPVQAVNAAQPGRAVNAAQPGRLAVRAVPAVQRMMTPVVPATQAMQATSRAATDVVVQAVAVPQRVPQQYNQVQTVTASMVTQSHYATGMVMGPDGLQPRKRGRGRPRGSKDTKRRKKRSTGEHGVELVRPYKCSYENCDKAYAQKGSLIKHIRSHTGEKPFKCHHVGCTKAYVSSTGLDYHLRTHTGERPYKCTWTTDPRNQSGETCVKAFKQPSDLTVHMRTHTGERPFKCTYEGCDKAFADSSHRSRHMWSHKGEKPCACTYEGCGKRFARPSSLKAHMRTHNNGIVEPPKQPPVPTVKPGPPTAQPVQAARVFKCTYQGGCGKAYARQATLAAHMRSHMVQNRSAAKVVAVKKIETGVPVKPVPVAVAAVIRGASNANAVATVATVATAVPRQAPPQAAK